MICLAILIGVLELYPLLQVSVWGYLNVMILFIYLTLTVEMHMEDMYQMVILYCYDFIICQIFLSLFFQPSFHHL